MEGTLDSIISRLSGDAFGIYAVLTELVLIGLCVNWCAGVLHGTRGTRPLRGVLIMLVAATLVVRGFGWARLDLLYSYVLIGLAFIGLVVFQPELRRAVIRAGDVRFRKWGQPQAQLITALVKSAGYLSRNKYGALIAIQRQVDLTGWAENGTMIRSEASATLLNTIFFPNSPLHDLGAIVRGNRIIAANCQFPSADSDEIDTTLGSRHLAAIGMSYETDALVLVVSEETGVISLADNGKLTRYLSLDDLSDELAARLQGKTAAPDEKSKQKGTGSRVWKVLRRALVVVPLTLVIWYIADQATLAQTDVQLRLQLRHTQPDLIVDVAGGPQVTFAATFTGPVRSIDRLDALPEPVDVTWELDSSYRPRSYALGREQIRDIVAKLRETRGRGSSVSSVDLAELRFDVAETVTLAATVQPNAEDVQVEVARIEPPEVHVTVRRGDLPPDFEGREAIVPAPLGRRLTTVRIGEMVTLDRVRLERRLLLDRQPTPINVVRIQPDEVGVELSVVGERRRIENVVVRLFVSPEVLERYKVTQPDLNEWRVSFEVEGSEAVLGRLGPHSFDAVALVTTDLLPPAGAPTVIQLRTLDVVIVPKDRGVTVLGRRTVRINLVPHERTAP